jgi:hypothetical protein
VTVGVRSVLPVDGVHLLFGDLSVDKRSQSDTVLEGYDPFLSDGYVSLLGQNAHSKPIKILRDTGASQSLLLADTLVFV